MDFYFSHARTALKYGLQALGFEPNSELLIPALTCDVITHPLADLGIIPKYYKVLPSLQPDWSQLSNLVNNKTCGLMVIHYFGQPQDLEKSQNFCRIHDIKLIEDNAHGFGGTFDGRPMGTFGDIGISSPRKSFGWRNGGLLHWNVEAIPTFPNMPTQPGVVIWKSKILIKSVLSGIKGCKRLLKKEPDYTSQETGRECPIPSWGMDPEYILRVKTKKNELDLLTTGRRSLWEIWKRWATLNRLSPIYQELAPGARPLSFPVRTKSAKESQKWFHWGWEMGLYVHSWPTLPRDILEQDPYTLDLWRNMVCFPIEPDMTVEKLINRLRI